MSVDPNKLIYLSHLPQSREALIYRFQQIIRPDQMPGIFESLTWSLAFFPSDDDIVYHQPIPMCLVWNKYKNTRNQAGRFNVSAGVMIIERRPHTTSHKKVAQRVLAGDDQ